MHSTEHGSVGVSMNAADDTSSTTYPLTLLRWPVKISLLSVNTMSVDWKCSTLVMRPWSPSGSTSLTFAHRSGGFPSLW